MARLIPRGTSSTPLPNLLPAIWESSRISRYYFAPPGCFASSVPADAPVIAGHAATRSVELMGRAWNELIFHRGARVSLVKRDKKCSNTSWCERGLDGIFGTNVARDLRLFRSECGFPLLFFLLFNFVRSEWLIDKTQPSFHINDLKIYVSFLRILITFQFSKKSFLSKELQRIFRKWYFFIDFDTYIYLYIWFIPYIRKGRCYSYFYQGINLRVIFAPP